MATLESQLSQQVVGNLAADILAAEPPILGLIQASQFVDGGTPKGKTRVTLNWTAPIRNEFIAGELLKNPDGSPDLADGVAGALHETQFDPITAGSFTVYERTSASTNVKTLTASAAHGQRIINIGTPVPGDIAVGAKVVIDDGVANKEEYAEVKAVNTLTGDVTLVDGLFYPHASGAAVKAATLSAKALGTHYNLELATAHSGFEALESIQNQVPHLIIMDVMMPGMSGLELLDRLRRVPESARIPVMVLTGYVDAAERARAAGAQEVIVKPFDRKVFVAKVMQLLQKPAQA